MRYIILTFLLCFVSTYPVVAETPNPKALIATKSAERAPADELEHPKDTGTNSVQQVRQSSESDAFCSSIIEPAREHRYFLKQQELNTLLKTVNERLMFLEKRKVEVEGWITKREEFVKRATSSLVEIYATMKPEAAAGRLSELNTELAASLLLAVTPRQASAILNEMDEKTAASITGIMSASANVKDPS